MGRRGSVSFDRHEPGGAARRAPGQGSLPTPLRRGRRGPGLSSARDRRGLRERSAAERARVEEMLAAAPVPTDFELDARPAGRRSDPARPSGSRPGGVIRALPTSAAPRCPVCARADVALDEVRHAGTLLLAACRHCEHRWTERPQRGFAELGAAMAGAPRGRVPERPQRGAPTSREAREPRQAYEESLRLVASDPDMLLDLPF